MKTGFIAGAIGAVILVVVMYLLFLTNLGGVPGFVGIYRAFFGQNFPLDHILSILGFILAGGIWGLIFALLVRIPTVSKGIVFGILPSLFLWLVIAPAIGNPLFNGFTAQGIILPLIYNVVIWGSFVGWFCQRSQYARRGSFTNQL